MTVQCESCRKTFDDADCTTICPHDLIMPAAMLEQKKRGLALLEKPIRFNHHSSSERLRVQSVGWDGMVTLHGMAGEFAPHLFTILDTEASTSEFIREMDELLAERFPGTQWGDLGAWAQDQIKRIRLLGFNAEETLWMFQGENPAKVVR